MASVAIMGPFPLTADSAADGDQRRPVMQQRLSTYLGGKERKGEKKRSRGLV